MFGAFKKFGKLGALASSVARAWSPLALWPDGAASPGMWIDPSLLTASFNDYTGTTPVATPGSVADSANPVGLALDIRAGATVLTDPGNHMLQATSAARPLLSARRNLLTYTEDFGNAVWSPYDISKTPNSGIAPDGTTTACLVKESTSTTQHMLGAPTFGTIAAGTQCNVSWYVKNAGVNYVLITFDGLGGYASATFDLMNAVFVRENHIGSDMYVPGSAKVESVADGYLRIAASFSASATGAWSSTIKLNRPNINSQDPTYAGDGTSGLYIWHPQSGFGLTATPYQSVPGDGSTYSATGITPWQLYDGVDDGMATASFAAGTLINGMDCMIAVRRSNNLLSQILGLYQADQTKYFGVVAETSPNIAGTFGGCGTPTIFVNNVETANTRGDLFDAMPFGEWFILEYRGLDLSAWVNANFGNYGFGYAVNGARGDILLFPSTASTEDKDAARQYLADKYGVTLP